MLQLSVGGAQSGLSLLSLDTTTRRPTEHEGCRFHSPGSPVACLHVRENWRGGEEAAPGPAARRQRSFPADLRPSARKNTRPTFDLWPALCRREGKPGPATGRVGCDGGGGGGGAAESRASCLFNIFILISALRTQRRIHPENWIISLR